MILGPEVQDFAEPFLTEAKLAAESFVLNTLVGAIHQGRDRQGDDFGQIVG
jgi:hypothetical protein